jgi:hypothetical protein
MARKLQERKGKPRVAIVGEGETEKIYFADVKDTDRPADIDLFPTLPARTGDYSKVLEKAVELATDEGYVKVFALIDMDTVINDGKEQPYAAAKQVAETKGVIVLENNPCFEIWLLLHFTPTSRSFTRCDDVVDELKRPGRIPGYEKSQRFLLRARLYANYKEQLKQQAIPAARQLAANRPEDNRHYPQAGVYAFFDWYFSEYRAKLH